MVYAYCFGEAILKHEVAEEHLTVWEETLESNMGCDMQN